MIEDPSSLDATGDDWRIDDLAQRAGITVDTIRYYQREGLLPSGERIGRTLRYGPEHLERLERIRGLQARRFSLAAIAALLDHDGTVEGLLAGREGATYDLDALVTAAGASIELAEGLERAGLLRSPTEYGRDAYDGEDVDVLRAFADLGALGVPDDVLVERAVVVAERVDQLQHAVVSLFAGRSGPGWSAAQRQQFHAGKAEHSVRVVRDMRTVMSYVQHRTIQRIVLEELNRPDAG
ncbi:MAG TPA: MerR family transcriptional regulator [Acidimicrobiia bacterium]|nr:MerR family transcriptional regulator [Acidimicrobiia bacterium]